jgi:hypothetical protein
MLFLWLRRLDIECFLTEQSIPPNTKPKKKKIQHGPSQKSIAHSAHSEILRYTISATFCGLHVSWKMRRRREAGDAGAPACGLVFALGPELPSILLLPLRVLRVFTDIFNQPKYKGWYV